MRFLNIVPQLRTTNLAQSIRFYTEKLGFTLEFTYDDFYAGVRAGGQLVHLKLVDVADPSIEFVHLGEHFHLYVDVDDVSAAAERLLAADVHIERNVHETPWRTRELVLRDDQGHTIYFGQAVEQAAASQP